MGDAVYTFLIDDGPGRRSRCPRRILERFSLEASAPPWSLPPDDVHELLQDTDAWGVKKTAPYFHDGSAKTLDDVLGEYEYLQRQPIRPHHETDRRDKKDIVEY